MHPPGFFTAGRIENTLLPAQLLPYLVCSSRGLVIVHLALAGIGKPTTMTANEDTATVEDCYAPPTVLPRTQEPDTFPPEVTIRPIQTYRIILVFPFAIPAQVAIVQDYPIRFGKYSNGSEHLIIQTSLPDEAMPRYQHPSRCQRRVSMERYSSTVFFASSRQCCPLPLPPICQLQIFYLRVLPKSSGNINTLTSLIARFGGHFCP